MFLGSLLRSAGFTHCSRDLVFEISRFQMAPKASWACDKGFLVCSAAGPHGRLSWKTTLFRPLFHAAAMLSVYSLAARLARMKEAPKASHAVIFVFPHISGFHFEELEQVACGKNKYSASQPPVLRKRSSQHQAKM